MPFIEQLGMQAASGAVGAGMGLLLGNYNDRRQREQQQDLNRIQIQGQKEMSDYNYQQQMKMWRETNYGPQMEELKKAGLNPGLIYGMSGGGATTTGHQGGNVQGASAPQGGGEAIASAGMGIQMGMAAAQKELIEAQTRNVEADTAKKSGVDTQEGQARIASLTQGIKNAKVAEELSKLELKFQGETLEDREDYIYYVTKKTMFEQEMAERSNYIQKATRDEQVAIIRRAATEAWLRNRLTQAQTAEVGSKIQVNQAQIKQWATQLTQGWEQLDKKEKEIRIQAFRAEIEAKQPGLFNVLGGVLSGALDEISDLTTGRDNRYRQERKVDLKTK